MTLCLPGRSAVRNTPPSETDAIRMLRQAIHQNGMTFLEIVVALAIAAILVAMAVPSFQSLMARSQMSATVNTLVYSLQSARSEAVKRSTSVGICISANPMDDDAVCDGTSYENGWIVYVDTDGDGERDSGAGEEVVLRVEERHGAFAFKPTTAFATQVYFNDSGNSVNTSGTPLSGRIDIDYAGGTDLRVVQVSANGRISTETP